MLLLIAVAVGCAGLAGFGFLAAVDRGALDGPLARFASNRLKRPVAFQGLHTHLLSATPTITIDGLRIGNAPWAGPANLLEAQRLRLVFRWPGLLGGRPSEIDIDHPRVALLRLTRERSNWSSGGGAGGFLQSVRRLRITDGRFTFDDRVRDMRLSGTLVHDAAENAARPLAISAEGMLKGGEIRVGLRGAPLQNRPRDAPYPFTASLQDGATFVTATGVSDQPLQLSGFDLSVAARGPNLADMKYLIGVGLPNSAPYDLTARLARQGRTTRATGLKATVGRSDFTGSIVSDGSKPRRLITVALDSSTLYAADVGAFLAHIPPHQVTRSVSGAASGKGGGGPLLSTKPIDLKRFRQKDALLKITAARFVVGGLSPGRLSTVGTLNHGKFELKPFSLAFPSGRADGVLGMDLNGPAPAFRLDGTVRNATLASLAPELAKTLNGVADLEVHVSGAGGSWRAVGLNAQGRIALRLRDGDIQKAKASVVSGAVIQGAFTALANKNARTQLSCAVAEMGVGGGQIRTRRMVLVTDVGTAVGEGGVDLGRETIDLTIYGRPSKFRLFSVSRPVSVTGPMLHPQAKVHLGGQDASQPAAATPEPPKVEGDRRQFCDSLLQARAP